jgi:hypothetical protein
MLALAGAVILRSKSRGTLDQIPIFISTRNRVAQIYPQAQGSILIVSYNSQGYDGGI